MQKREKRGQSEPSTTENEKDGRVQNPTSQEKALEILKSVYDRRNPPDGWLRRRALGILNSVDDGSKLPKEVADELNMSVENVRYHLNKLKEGGFVEVTDTRHTEEGCEVSVYEPSDRYSLILFGREDSEVLDVLKSVRNTPKTSKEVGDRLDIPVHRVERHLKKLEREHPALVESKNIWRKAVVWSATEAGTEYLSNSSNQEQV